MTNNNLINTLIIQSTQVNADTLIGETMQLYYGNVSPCIGKTWSQCLRYEFNGKWYLWYNDNDSHSTKTVIGF